MKNEIEPHRVTKPIQLLAAWLVGLVLIDSSFLTAARLVSSPSWVGGLLVIAAITNVPLFLLCIFLLQTRFRPEMQEDTFYSEYLRDVMTGKPVQGSIEISNLRQEMATTYGELLTTVRELQSQFLELVTHTPSESRGRFPGDDGRSDAISRLTERAVQMDARLGDAIEGSVLDLASIEMNDLLPSFDAIKLELQKEGLKISSTFGSSSSPPRTPRVFITSFSRGIPEIVFKRVLKVLLAHGVQGLQIADDAFGAHKIYIGSFGYEVGGYAPVSEELITELLKENMTEDRYRAVIEANTPKLKS